MSPDPLQQHLRESGRDARSGLTGLLRGAFSSKSGRFLAVLAVAVTLGLLLFRLGVFGETSINITLGGIGKSDGLSRGLVGHWTFDNLSVDSSTLTDKAGNSASGSLNGGKFVYSSVGTTTLVVPAGVTEITVKAWGAGGGGGGGHSSGGTITGGVGGGGGYVTGSVAVTPGEMLTVQVGGKGTGGSGSTSSTAGGWGGGGGGFSAVHRNLTYLFIAGAGGGGGGSDDQAPATGASGGAGGPGGGLMGTDGTAAGNPVAAAGSGGTQSAGGNYGSGSNGTGTAGSKYNGGKGAGGTDGGGGAGGVPGGNGGGTGDSGGNDTGGAGGGGGGYYGGAGGGANDGATSDGAAGGGGGSSYMISSAVLNSTSTTAGNGATAANASDGDYISGVGSGGTAGADTGSTASAGGNGGDGLVVITYGSTTTTPIPAAGRLGQGIILNGAQTFSVPNASVIDPNTSLWSISLWVKTTSDGYILFKGKPGGTGDDHYALRVNQGYAVFQFAASNASNDIAIATSTTLVNDGAWHHIVGMRAAEKTAAIYVDDVNEDTDTYAGSGMDVNTTLALLVGSQSTTTVGTGFSGYLDDLRIYNRALSDNEIQRLHDLGATTHINITLGGKDSSPTLAQGLVGHWTFDGKSMYQNVGDASGSGNKGYLNGYTSTTTVPGRIGQALDLNGTSNYALIPASSSLAPTYLTVAAWVKLDSLITAGNFAVSHGHDGQAGNYRLWTYNVGNVAGYSLGHYTNGLSVTGSTISTGVWTHRAMTWDGTTLRAYLNGVPDGTDTTGTYTADSSLGLYLGRSPYASFEYWVDGQIDDVRVYNRALSAEEIVRLYEIGGTTHINMSLGTQSANPILAGGLIGHWTFDGKSMYQNVADSSGSGNKGYLGSSTSTTTAPGRIGQAFQFDGVNDSVVVPYASSLNNITSKITFSAWVYPDNGTLSSRRDIINRTGVGCGNIWWFNLQNSGKVSFYADNITGGVYKQSTNTISAGTWSYVSVAYDGSNIRFYINGVLDNTIATTGSFVTDTTHNCGLTIGKNGFDGSTPFQGSIDDVRIYSRAVTPDEIKRLYELGH